MRQKSVDGCACKRGRLGRPWTRYRYADTNCDLCPIGGGGRCTATKGHAPRAAVVALKRFERRATAVHAAVIVGVVVGARSFPTSQTFHLLVHANRLYEAGFCRNRRRDSRPRCDRRLWNADSFLLAHRRTLHDKHAVGHGSRGEGLVLKWFFIPSLISNLPPFRLVTDQIFIRFRFFLSFFLFVLFVSGEREGRRGYVSGRRSNSSETNEVFSFFLFFFPVVNDTSEIVDLFLSMSFCFYVTSKIVKHERCSLSVVLIMRERWYRCVWFWKKWVCEIVFKWF